MKFYICPNCKERQTTVHEWITVSIAIEFNLRTKKSNYGVRHEGGDHEAWSCPTCGQDLPRKISKKLEKYLFD